MFNIFRDFVEHFSRVLKEFLPSTHVEGLFLTLSVYALMKRISIPYFATKEPGNNPEC